MSNELCHYGVKGMKWGVRRYRNQDGSLNTDGIQRELRKQYKVERKQASNRSERKQAKKNYQRAVFNTYSKKYNPVDRVRDQNMLGEKGVNRINDRINAGMPVQEARKKEYHRETTKRILAVTGGAALSVISARYGSRGREVISSMLRR